MSTQSKGFDLGNTSGVQEAEDEGTVIEVLDQNADVMEHGKGKKVTMRVAGSYSKRYKSAQHKQTNRALKGKRTKFDAELLDTQRQEVAAACVMEWSGFFDGGAPLECSRANALAVFAAAPWILPQVEVAIEDHASFTGTNSPS